MQITPEEFLILAMLQNQSYKEISKNNNIPRAVLSKWWVENETLRDKISRARALYKSRAKSANDGKFYFGFSTAVIFYNWFKTQPEECMYCGIEAHKLRRIFDKDNGVLRTKRGRGRVLELERIDSNISDYSEANCGLACYICNNHKSDLISKEDYIKHFRKPVFEYLNEKYLDAEKHSA